MADGSLYYDGITIRADGSVKNPRQPERTEAKKVKLDKLVSRYVKAFATQIKREGKLPEPNAGDCWFCSMTVKSPEKDRGKSLGESTGDVDHIFSHLKEKYVFGSILWRAAQRRGNPSICWQLANSRAAQGDASFLIGDLRYYLRNLKPAMLELMK
jgi:hypothetical protein